MNRTVRTVAVDLDDVLFDFVGHFFTWHNDQYGTQLSPENMVHAKLWQVWGGTKDQAAERVPRFFREIDMARLEPMKGAVEALRVLRHDFRLSIISARDLSATASTTAWIDRFFPGFFEQVVLGISNPIATANRRTKGDICLEIGAGLLIDDQVVNAADAAAAGLQAILFGNLPWNRVGKLPENTKRGRDWPHVVSLLLGQSSPM